MAGKRETYKKDYEIVETLTGSGSRTKKEIVYHGKHYKYDMTDEAFVKLKIKYAILNVLSLLFYLLMAVLPCRSMGAGGVQASFYVLMPYVITVIPMGMTLAKTVLLLTRPRAMEFVDYDKYVVHLKYHTVASAIGVGISALGQLAYIAFVNPEGGLLYELLFVACGLVCGGVTLIYYRFQQKQNVTAM